MNTEELKEMHEQTERKEFIKKILISIVTSLLGTVVSMLLLTKNQPTIYPIHRAIYLFLAYWFVVLHLCIPLGDMYDFITKHRYKLALGILVFMTLMQYTTSSNSIFSSFTFEADKNNSIIGNGSNSGFLYFDYAVEEPIAVAQESNNYARFNNKIGGIDTDLDALVHSPVKNIFIIAKLYNVGYLLLGSHMGLAFETTFKLLFVLLASYEFLMMLTNNKKAHAIVGSVVLATSIASQIDAALIIACVETILVLFDKFMLEESTKKKCLYVCGMTIALLTYMFTFYLPYIIAFGYFMIAALVWIVLKNFKEYKFKIIDIVLILGGLIVTFIISISFYYSSEGVIKYLFDTVYPGRGDTYRVNGLPLLFSYLFNYLIPFKAHQISPAVYGGIFSLFPITAIIAFYYAFYKDKYQEFFMPMVVYLTIIIVATVSKFPDVINDISFFKYVYQVEASVVADFVGFLIMMFYIGNVQENIFKVKGRIRFLVGIMIIIAIMNYPAYILEHRMHLSVIAVVICWCGYSFLAANKKEYRGALLFFLVVLSITGVFLKPVTIGAHGITDLNISHKIQEISKNDKEAKWVALNDVPMGMANFIVANGGTSLNAVPFYQGEDFYKAVLGEEKALETKEIWNRYAHVLVELDKECSIEKNEYEDDILTLKLDKNALNNLNVKYLVTYMDQNELEKEGYKVTKLFETLNNSEITFDDVTPKGIFIYEIN